MASLASSQSFLFAIAFWTRAHPRIASFQWQPGSTFASSPTFLVSAILSYLLVTLLLHQFLSARKSPVPLGPLPVIHNVVLLTGSLLIFVGCAMATLCEIGLLPEPASSATTPTPTPSSWHWVFCFPRGTRASGPVFFWSYVYYLSKFYELLDTVILVLKRRPLTFLHVFHHAVVIIMSFFWLQYSQSLQIFIVLANTAVHVLMYSYYLQCSLGKAPFWKKIVTNCQIVQFIGSFMVSGVMLYLHFFGNGCQGFAAWTFNACFNGTLLVLFINFHRSQYTAQKTANQKNIQPPWSKED